MNLNENITTPTENTSFFLKRVKQAWWKLSVSVWRQRGSSTGFWLGFSASCLFFIDVGKLSSSGKKRHFVSTLLVTVGFINSDSHLCSIIQYQLNAWKANLLSISWRGACSQEAWHCFGLGVAPHRYWKKLFKTAKSWHSRRKCESV